MPFSSNAASDGAPDFESAVAPLLVKRCVECHQGSDPAGGFSLTSRQELLAGGDSGAAIDTHDPGASFLLQRLADGEMPPEKQGRPQRLPPGEIELVRRWVDSGAKWPADRKLDYFERTNELRAGRDWWSLQPIVRPELPELKTRPQPSNPIDVLVRAKLEAAGIEPAPPADRRTLIRRLYYDLIGLPPTEAEIEAFLRDESPDAWPKLIDRLLDMPQYGERWGRYWLDLARYADTSGYERDQEKPFAWKYRDWVVSALNTDVPYDQFIIQQLAGDEIDGRDQQSVIATGFLRLGTWNDEPNDPADYQYERLEDLVHTTSSAFLALTVKCARCHSHKFDAITQDDYYRMASAFWAGPIAARDRADLGGPTTSELGFPDVLGWTDVSLNPAPLHVLKSGERSRPLAEVVPASLSTIPSLEREFAPPSSGATTSRRRLQLARWIADPRHPLTDRVLVNRLWQHHFGKAIVRTPNNFGFLADPPTHPQLLDWLAAEFQAQGRRLKPIHRLILTSQTWRQASLHPAGRRLEMRDAGNRLWWRAERRRLDAESLRDSLLAASGELDLTVGGPGFKPTLSPAALEGLSRKAAAWQASPEEAQRRRSLYIYSKRSLLPPLMTTFDLCDPTQSCGQRNMSIVPTQALVLLNNSFVHARSRQLATVIAATQSNVDSQIQMAWSHVLKRQPTRRELTMARQHLEAQRVQFATPIETRSASKTAELVSKIRASLVFHLRADRSVTASGDDLSVVSLPDLSGRGHDASQADPAARPLLDKQGFGGQPTLVFDGQGRSLKVAGKLLERAECTIICAIQDVEGSGHREVISNWNGAAGNSTRSLFLGMTADNQVRFSDAFAPAGEIVDRRKPFLLSAVNGPQQAAVYQNSRLLKSAPRLPSRRLDTPWVIGQQGNINGEYWKGGIAEVHVYDRALSDDERVLVEQQLASHYKIGLVTRRKSSQFSPDVLALASLCHVLLNSNEFLYVD